MAKESPTAFTDSASSSKETRRIFAPAWKNLSSRLVPVELRHFFMPCHHSLGLFLLVICLFFSHRSRAAPRRVYANRGCPTTTTSMFSCPSGRGRRKLEMKVSIFRSPVLIASLRFRFRRPISWNARRFWEKILRQWLTENDDWKSDSLRK